MLIRKCSIAVAIFVRIKELYTGNQQLMQKWFREKIHLVAVAGQNHYFKDGLLIEAVWCNTNIKSSSNYWWQMTYSNEKLFLKMQQ